MTCHIGCYRNPEHGRMGKGWRKAREIACKGTHFDSTLGISLSNLWPAGVTRINNNSELYM